MLILFVNLIGKNIAIKFSIFLDVTILKKTLPKIQGQVFQILNIQRHSTSTRQQFQVLQKFK